MQISATLVKGKARIQFQGSGGAGKVCGGQGQYSLARAQQSFKSLVQIHEKNGKNLFVLYCVNYCNKYFVFWQVGSHLQKRMANEHWIAEKIPKIWYMLTAETLIRCVPNK